MKLLKSLLAPDGRGSDPDPDAAPLAVAQLLLEIARVDTTVEAAELAVIRGHLQQAYGLADAQLAALIARANEQVERSISFHDTVRQINAALSADDKQALVTALWRVAHADARVDPHEEALLRRLADLLHVPHSAFVRAKLRAQDAPP
jgi:uncharacterized tellurite resistance protein B-like protein